MIIRHEFIITLTLNVFRVPLLLLLLFARASFFSSWLEDVSFSPFCGPLFACWLIFFVVWESSSPNAIDTTPRVVFISCTEKMWHETNMRGKSDEPRSDQHEFCCKHRQGSLAFHLFHTGDEGCSPIHPLCKNNYIYREWSLHLRQTTISTEASRLTSATVMNS